MQLFLELHLKLTEINPLAKLTNVKFIMRDGQVDTAVEVRGAHRAPRADLGILRICCSFPVGAGGTAVDGTL